MWEGRGPCQSRAGPGREGPPLSLCSLGFKTFLVSNICVFMQYKEGVVVFLEYQRSRPKTKCKKLFLTHTAIDRYPATTLSPFYLLPTNLTYTHMHTHTHTCIHTYTHTHLHTHTHTHRCYITLTQSLHLTMSGHRQDGDHQGPG